MQRGVVTILDISRQVARMRIVHYCKPPAADHPNRVPLSMDSLIRGFSVYIGRLRPFQQPLSASYDVAIGTMHNGWTLGPP